MAGLPNNIDFLVKIVKHHGFTDEQPTTAFFEKYMTGILRDLAPQPLKNMAPATKLAVASLMEHWRWRESQDGVGVWGGGESNGFGLSGWRGAGSGPVMRTLNLTDGKGTDSVAVNIASQGAGNEFLLSLAGDKHNHQNHRCVIVNKLLVHPPTKALNCAVWNNSIEIDGHLYSGTVSIAVHEVTKALVVDTWMDAQIGTTATHYQIVVPPPDFAAGESAQSGNPQIRSPMPGKIIKVLVKSGQQIKAGEPMVILEAMKMEHVMSAPSSG